MSSFRAVFTYTVRKRKLLLGRHEFPHNQYLFDLIYREIAPKRLSFVMDSIEMSLNEERNGNILNGFVSFRVTDAY